MIDDDPSMLRLAAAILRRGEYNVSIASNAEQALVTLYAFPADVILVDMRLPGLSGLDLVRRLRSESRSQEKQIVVLAMTAFSQADIETSAREAGCDGYLRKPFTPEELLTFVKEHLGSGPRRAPAAAVDGIAEPASAFLKHACSRCLELLSDLDAGYPDSAASAVLRRIALEGSQYGFDVIPPLALKAADILDWFIRDPSGLKHALAGLTAELGRLNAEADIKGGHQSMNPAGNAAAIL